MLAYDIGPCIARETSNLVVGFELSSVECWEGEAVQFQYFAIVLCRNCLSVLLSRLLVTNGCFWIGTRIGENGI